MDISQEQIYQELLKEKSDKELHEMDENELIFLILEVLKRLEKKKMKKEVKLIYI
ncbi:MAG: hypothetical protein ACFE94_15790 [Candidatus Hodarchaeota archaeon]